MERLKTLRISKYSKEPTSHFTAVNSIAAKHNMKPVDVDKMVRSFFGKHGLLYFIKKRLKIRVNNLGTFYYHKKTAESYRKRNKSKAYIRECYKKYNEPL